MKFDFLEVDRPKYLDINRHKDMSELWGKIQKLPIQYITELTSFYAKIFPIEIRDGLSDWIEAQPWKQVDENDQSHSHYAIGLLETLLTDVYNKVKIMPALEPLLQNLQNTYTTSPLLLVRDIKICLEFEEQLLTRYQNDVETNLTDIDDTPCDILRITKEFKTLQCYESHILQTIADLKKKQEEFSIRLAELPLVTDHFKKTQEEIDADRKLIDDINTENIAELGKKSKELQSQLDNIQVLFVNCIKDINELAAKLIIAFNGVLDAAKLVQNKILKEDIPEWKQRQQMSCNGDYLNPAELGTIQKRCEYLGNYITKYVQQILQMETILNHLPLKGQQEFIKTLRDLRGKLAELLFELLSKCFIVEHQPPQVLRKDTKFEACATLLVSKAINIEESLPKITAFVISEDSARVIKSKKDSTAKPCGVLLNNETTVDCRQCGSLSGKFKNLILKQYKRESKKTGQKVSEEKYCIVFECKVVVRIGQLRISRGLKTLSVPVIITTNVSQECQALATIMWDHQFSSQGRKLFNVPEQVLWKAMANLLDKKFKHETGRGLNKLNLNYLASKIFGQAEDYSSFEISINMFCKTNMKGTSFTFWDWFYHIMRLTKEHLARQWKDGHIAGFVSKEDSEIMLHQSQPGVFLCRFSDTKLGGISVSERTISNVLRTEPFTVKDLQISSLSKIINDQEKWTHLYPDKTKEDTFGRYANEEMTRPDAQSQYEKFIWIVKLKRENDEQDIEEEDCLKCLNDLLDGTDVTQFVQGSNDDREENMMTD